MSDPFPASAEDRVRARLHAVGSLIGIPPAAFAGLLLTGEEPAYRSSFRVGEFAQATAALSGVAAAELFKTRGGGVQSVAVDLLDAAIEFESFAHLRVAGEPLGDPWDPLAGAYPCRDGRWIRVHTNYPHHRAALLGLLGTEGDRDAVGEAISRWDAIALEDALQAAGGIGAAVRSSEEWNATAQAAALESAPAIDIRGLGVEAEARSADRPAQPMSGIRVLDLTRVLAGPVATRVLAAHGADVLTINGPDLPNSRVAFADTNRGKRSALLDLGRRDGREKLLELVATADIFVQSYAPGALDRLGLDAETLAMVRPGLIQVSLTAYGQHGPWAKRKGFDSIVQAATGINHDEAVALGKPGAAALPCQALDYGAGYLMAAAAMSALAARHRCGRGAAIHVSLARTAQLLRSFGRLDPAAGTPGLTPGSAERHLVRRAGVAAVRHPARLGLSPATDFLTLSTIGDSEPAWRAATPGPCEPPAAPAG